MTLRFHVLFLFFTTGHALNFIFHSDETVSIKDIIEIKSTDCHYVHHISFLLRIMNCIVCDLSRN